MGQLRRKAFIVGAEAVAGEQHLPGVAKDKARLRTFLTSDNGGAWEREEIDLLEKPAFPPVQGSPAPTFDYILFYFAGHGYTQEGQTYLCVNDHQDVPLDNLWLSAHRQLIILDSCRTRLPETQAFEGHEKTSGVLAGVPDFSYRESCRDLYNAAIMRAEKGRIVLFASAWDEAANESARGGDFTFNLVTSAMDWIVTARKAAPKVLTVQDAFTRADSRMNRLLQNPEYWPGRRLFHFPWAIVP